MRQRNRGSVLLTAMSIVLIVAGIAGALITIASAHIRTTGRARSALQALYTAEAGAALCLDDLDHGGPGVDSGRFGDGTFTVRVTTDGDRSELVAEGVHGGIRRAIEVVAVRSPGSRTNIVSWRRLP